MGERTTAKLTNLVHTNLIHYTLFYMKKIILIALLLLPVIALAATGEKDLIEYIDPVLENGEWVCPANSYYNETFEACVCDEGTELNEDGSQCVSIEVYTCPPHSHSAAPDGGNCQCDPGYLLNYWQDICQPDYLIQPPEPVYEMSEYTDDLNNRVNYAGRTIYTDRPEEMPVGYMIKAHSDPKCYVMLEDGTLYWVVSEEAALRIFGEGWDNQIIWLEESLVYTYEFGDSIAE